MNAQYIKDNTYLHINAQELQHNTPANTYTIIYIYGKTSELKHTIE